MPWKQGVQLEIDTRHFAASLTSHDFINEPLAPLEPSPFSALARVLLLSSSYRAYRFSFCVPPVSGVTRHFSWDAILIAVLRLKRLLRFAITLRRVHRIFCSRSEFSIFLAEVLPGRTKLIRSQIIIWACIVNISKNRSSSLIARVSIFKKTKRNRDYFYSIVHIFALYIFVFFEKTRWDKDIPLRNIFISTWRLRKINVTDKKFILKF